MLVSLRGTISYYFFKWTRIFMYNTGQRLSFKVAIATLFHSSKKVKKAITGSFKPDCKCQGHQHQHKNDDCVFKQN